MELDKSHGMRNVPEPGIEGFSKANLVLKVLNWRQTEVKAVEDNCKLLRNFIKICSSFESGTPFFFHFYLILCNELINKAPDWRFRLIMIV